MWSAALWLGAALGAVLGVAWHYSYWARRGVPCPRPVPLFGNVLSLLLGSESYTEALTGLYAAFPGAPLVGFWVCASPALLVRDPGLFPALLVSDFAHFPDRGFGDSETLDPLLGHLVNLAGAPWRLVRAKLAPVFSAGRLRGLQPVLLERARELSAAVAGAESPLDPRSLASGFALEVMSSVVLSLPPGPPAPLVELVAESFASSPLINLRSVVRYVCPGLLSLLRWKRFPRRTEHFMFDLVRQRARLTDNNSAQGNDILQHLIQVRKENNEKASTNGTVTENLVVANTYVMFVAGVETTGSVIGFCLYELAVNQHVQETLYREVSSVLARNQDFPPEALKDLNYLDQVISETLRMYPSVQMTTRVCRKEYRVPGHDLVIEKGTKLLVPIFAIHHDPAYFPEPYSFRPERFSPENRHLVRKGTFIPFGDGPRICIGWRFARVELKVALATLVMKHKFFLNEKTPRRLSFSRNSVLLAPQQTILLDVEPRTT